jgi:type VI secretion system protein ImpA
LPGLESGLRLIAGLLDRHWEHVHPQLDPDDGDASLRVNAITELINPETLLKELREALVAPAVRQGRVRVRDVHIAAGKLEPREGDPRLTDAQISGLLLEAEKTHPGCLAAAMNTRVALDTIQRKLTEMLGAEIAPDLRPLADQLAPVGAVCARLLGEDAGAHAGASSSNGGASEADPSGSSSAGGHAGELRSVDDAVRILDRVCEFIDRTQPSHPAPLLLRRAQRLMKMNFVEIIADLAPDSVGTIKHLAGVKDE